MTEKMISLLMAVLMTVSPYCRDIINGINEDVPPFQEAINDNVLMPINQIQDLYDMLDEHDNVMISPMSINYALLMVANGADGISKKEMEKYFGDSIENITDKYATYLTDLSKISKQNLELANSLWYRNDVLMSEKYIESMKSLFNSDVSEIKSDAVKKINDWVDEKTHGKIKSIIDKLPNETQMILINALYYNNNWGNSFFLSTEPLEFTKSDNSVVEVNRMTDTVGGYMKVKNAEAFRKNYNNGYSFIAILPKDNNVKFSDIDIDALLKSEENYLKDETKVTMPKFSFDYSVSLNDTLKQIGLKTSFSDFANFSKMVDKYSYKISDVLHKTMIELDENGTTAAAVTSIHMAKTTAIMPEKKSHTIVLDRPFYFMIVDYYDNPLFIGHLESPN